MSKDVLITSGFPRSGNTFLNFALWQMYYPTEEFNKNFHTIKAINQNNKVLVPIRNPFGSIASWANFLGEQEELKASCKYYTRFYTEAKAMPDKVVFVDFDKMIVDLDYIKSLVKEHFGIDPVAETTIDAVKALMVEKAHDWNLPQNNQVELDAIKTALLSVPEFADCEVIYNTAISKLDSN
jgi:hypothetical protein